MRGVLTRRSNGPINTSYKYRNSGRRAFHINKRFKKKVELVQGHTLKYSTRTNAEFDGTTGEALFSVIDIGSPIENDILMAYAKTHYAGYKVADPNTTSGSSNQFKMKVKVLSFYRNLYAINSSNVKVYVTVYSLMPRHDIHDALLMPAVAMQTYLRSGDLADAGTIGRLVSDVDFHPYLVPAITQNWIITKTRHFAVHVGGRFNINMSHSYDINYGLDSQTFGWDTGIVAKKGHFRATMVKMVGELGVATTAANKFIRNLPFECIGRINSNVSLHVAQETRDIYLDENISATRNIGGITSDEVVHEETEIFAATDKLAPTVIT